MKRWILGLSGAAFLGLAAPVSALQVSSGGNVATFDLSGCPGCTLAQDGAKLGVIVTLPTIAAGHDLSPVIDFSVTDGGAPPNPVPLTAISVTIGGTGGTAGFLDTFGSSLLLSIPGSVSGLIDYTSLPVPDGIDSLQSDIAAGVTSVTVDLNTIPEPMSAAVLGLGLAGLAVGRRRRSPLAS